MATVDLQPLKSGCLSDVALHIAIHGFKSTRHFRHQAVNPQKHCCFLLPMDQLVSSLRNVLNNCSTLRLFWFMTLPEFSSNFRVKLSGISLSFCTDAVASSSLKVLKRLAKCSATSTPAFWRNLVGTEIPWLPNKRTPKHSLWAERKPSIKTDAWRNKVQVHIKNSLIYWLIEFWKHMLDPLGPTQRNSNSWKDRGPQRVLEHPRISGSSHPRRSKIQMINKTSKTIQKHDVIRTTAWCFAKRNESEQPPKKRRGLPQ